MPSPFRDLLIVATLLTASALFLWRGSAQPPSAERVVSVTPASLSSEPQYEPVPQAIETITVGQRMWIGENPSAERDHRVGADITDPSGWRQMTLRCPKRDGTQADVVMLRPVNWLAERQVRPGGKVQIDVPECGISGLADVLAVGPCPEIAQGPGRVVTATFHHHAASTIDVAIEGVAEPIGTTPNHPFWSESKQAFVRADQLGPGDEVRTLDGTACVLSLGPRGPPEPVYNLEVQFEHVYRVGEAGVLVHNGGFIPLTGLGHGTCFTPNNASRRDFGTATHQDFPQYLEDKFPGSEFDTYVGPGQTGPDAIWRGGKDPGFDVAELKPGTESGFKAFENQSGRWDYDRNGFFHYDPATGDISNGGVFH
ncbi:hypothetical protein Pla123a_19630 [Posidoniimonas polymericola]|uniref:Intein C-terminal splicing domain-containing protein n=1 Tax=Posidoniimonas polymericola TaxID=2528002 RepID=A0A5C5YQV9_9BACT|nr:polymorphic toxin-type HINT domain-containing protein [Posidoniimonas polymericola]TWT77305.1 hypothetical protein Pla123a_19630 [Posidoniimonas polymericola]